MTQPRLQDADRERLLSIYPAIKRGGRSTCELLDPVLRTVAEDALEAAVAHSQVAAPREITIFPQAKTEHVGNGVTKSMTTAELEAWLVTEAQLVRPKGDGQFLTMGATKNGRRRDEDCASVEWLALDADGTGDWVSLIAVLKAVGVAALLYRSARHSVNTPKWRLIVPFLRPWKTTGDVQRDRRRWKGELYLTARLVFGALAQLRGVGFDPATDGLLNRFYPGCRRPQDAHEPPREVVRLDGTALDLEDLFDALVGFGIAPRVAPRQSASQAAVPSASSRLPLIRAFAAAGWLGERRNGKWLVTCPWDLLHSTGKPWDSSTVIFEKGTFFCAHTHCRGRSLDEVVAALPARARRVYENARATAGIARLRAQLRAERERLAVGTVIPLPDVAETVRNVISVGEGLRVVRVPVGAGKTRAAIDALAELGEGILAHRDHALGDEVEKSLVARGVPVRRHRGVLAVVDEAGSPVCKYAERARALAEAGGNVPQLMCWRCDMRRTCQARKSSRRDRGVVLLPHALLGQLAKVTQ